MLILFAAAFGRLVYAITHATALVTAVPIMHASTQTTLPRLSHESEQPEQPGQPEQSGPPQELPGRTEEDLQFDMDLDLFETFQSTGKPPSIQLEPVPEPVLEPVQPVLEPVQRTERAEDDGAIMPSRRLFCSCWRL